MKIVTVQFQYPDFYDYVLLRDVFMESCKTEMPDVEFVNIEIPPPVKHPGKARNFKYNTTKLEIWCDILNKSDENIIFADCDMLCLRPAYHAFDNDFDVAVTWRTSVRWDNNKPRHRGQKGGGGIPMNGGIVMARPTEGAKLFFSEWDRVNKQMFKDSVFHKTWRNRYAGMNQAAFGYLYEELYLKNKLPGVKIHNYRTREWNAVNCDWQKVNGDTVFCHFKSKLRRMVLEKRPTNYQLAVVMNAWYDYAVKVRQNYYRPHSVPYTKIKRDEAVDKLNVSKKLKRKYKSKAGVIKIKKK